MGRLSKLLVCIAIIVWACSDDQSASTGSAGAQTTTQGAGGATSSTVGNGGAVGSGGMGMGGMSASIAFPPSWPDGTNCGSEDPIFVWKAADDTYILRQSLCTSFEGPFLYLLFGDDKVLLEDTGDGGIPVQSTVQGIIDDWLAAHAKTSIELIVAHSHGHGDHVAGDGQFQNQPNTTVVGISAAAVQTFFGITGWPDQIVTYDLGNRVLDIIPIPGHQSAHIAIYDRRHDLLLTADTLYPGRLYISDFAAYRASTQRLADFGAANSIAWVLGTHIEMTTTAGQDFNFGANQHPNEHELQLTPAHLTELNDAIQAMSSPMVQVHDDFIIYPL